VFRDPHEIEDRGKEDCGACIWFEQHSSTEVRSEYVYAFYSSPYHTYIPLSMLYSTRKLAPFPQLWPIKEQHLAISSAQAFHRRLRNTRMVPARGALQAPRTACCPTESRSRRRAEYRTAETPRLPRYGRGSALRVPTTRTGLEIKQGSDMSYVDEELPNRRHLQGS
jgi:hypothetical protein